MLESGELGGWDVKAMEGVGCPFIVDPVSRWSTEDVGWWLYGVSLDYQICEVRRALDQDMVLTSYPMIC